MSINPIEITDPADPRLADYVGLRDPEIRRRSADNQFFISEGVEVVRRLVVSNMRLRSIVLSPNRVDMMTPALANVACPIYVAERKVISSVVGFDMQRGVVGSALRPELQTLDEVLSHPPLYGPRHRIVILEGLSDHENLSAIACSARAFHIDAIVIDPTCADPYYRRTVRVSMGEILFLPIVRMDVDEAMSVVRRKSGSVLAFTPNLNAISLHDFVDTKPGPLALVFGSEGNGLPSETLSAADHQIRIPIAEDVDSLNVSHAAAVAFALTSPR
ncbi:MAG: RNA methyltransferase [Actinomycetota bacterium]|nr:RNA methyltransferase [Actinomycetota bacterium]MDA3021040.1 RNA methyltransferase [Actinomycetota bacterium]